MIPIALKNEAKAIMPDEENEVDLSKLGLSRAQAKVYLALIKLGNAKIKTIANTAKIDRANLYRTILRLHEIGLVEVLLGKPNTYRAITLEDGLQLLLRRKKEQFNEFQKIVNKLKENMKSNTTTTEILENSFVITPAKEGTLFSAKKAFLSAIKTHDAIINCSIYTRNLTDTEKRKTFEKALEEGIKFRYLIYCDLDNKQSILKLNKRYLFDYKGNVNIRFVTKSPEAFFVIIDGKELLMHTQALPNWVGTPCLQSTNICLVGVLQTYFNTLWANAQEN